VTIVKGHPNLVKLIQFFCYDCCNINFQCSCFHPLDSIIFGYKNIFVSYISSYWFDWPHKIKCPFYKSFLLKTCHELCKTLSYQSFCSLTCITRFVIIVHISVHSWLPISNIQYFSLCYFNCKMPPYLSFMQFSHHHLCFCSYQTSP